MGTNKTAPAKAVAPARRKRRALKPVKLTKEPDGTVRAWYRIKDLTLDPDNARDHGARDLEETGDSIMRFRQQKNIVIDADGIVRAGNGTCMALLEKGEDLVWGIVSHLRGDEAVAYGVKDNRTAELSRWNFEKLAENLKGLSGRGFAINTLGWADYELDPLMAAEWKPPEIGDLPTFSPGAPGSGAESDSKSAADMFSADEREVIERAITVMRHRSEDEEMTEGAAVAGICREWLKSVDGDEY